jgi:hypothetical protein
MMPWGRMDDKFHRNRKVRELRKTKPGREALGVWLYWWSWCLEDPELTGFVPAVDMPAADSKAASELVRVGLWDVVSDGYQFHDFEEYNPTRDKLEAKREADRKRIAEKRAASRGDVACDSPPSSGGQKYPRTRTRSHSSPDGEEGSDSGASPAPPSGPSVLEQVRELESAYPDVATIHEARDACAMSRRNGRMADTVWLRALQAMAEHPQDAVLRACRTFADKYSDGEKDERYLMGIVRGEAKGKRHKGPAQPSRQFDEKPLDEVFGPWAVESANA